MTQEDKKFLDAAGLAYFWTKCRLQEQENFQTNLEIFETIVQALSKKIESPDGEGGVSQYFTEEEKEKLRRILSISDEGVVTVEGSNGFNTTLVTQEGLNSKFNSIPVATTTTKGLVQLSEEIGTDANGALKIVKVSTDAVPGYSTLVEQVGLTKQLVGSPTDTSSSTLFGTVNSNFTKTVVGITSEVPGQINYQTGDGTTEIVTLKVATKDNPGVVKLYDSLGDNEDGTLNQKTLKALLNTKVGVDIEDGSSTLIFTTDNKEK